MRLGLRAPAVVLLACAVAFAPLVARAAPESEREHIKRAEDLRAGDKYAESAAEFAQAYRALPLEERAAEYGRDIVHRAVDDYLQAFTRDVKVELLEEAANVIDEFEADVRSVHAEAEPEAASLTGGTSSRRQSIDALRAKFEREEREHQRVDDPRPITRVDDDPDPRTIEPDPGPDALGIGLTAAGGVLTLLGIGLMIGGGNVIANKNRELDSNQDLDDAERDAYELRQNRRAVGWFAGGGASLAIGIAGLTWGSVLLARRERERERVRRASALPWFGPKRAGVSIVVRFATPRAFGAGARAR